MLTEMALARTEPERHRRALLADAENYRLARLARPAGLARPALLTRLTGALHRRRASGHPERSRPRG